VDERSDKVREKFSRKDNRMEANKRQLIHSQKFVTITLGEYKLTHEQGTAVAFLVDYPATAEKPRICRKSRRKRLTRAARNR